MNSNKYVKEMLVHYPDLHAAPDIIAVLEHLFEAAYLDGYEYGKGEWWKALDMDQDAISSLDPEYEGPTENMYEEYDKMMQEEIFGKEKDDGTHIPGLPFDRKPPEGDDDKE